MLRLLKASFFKLRKDMTLRVTLIIGLALSLLLTLLYFSLDSLAGSGYHSSATGQNMLINSFSPTSNFGIAIPINLVIFTVCEFTQGTIRNKVVVGNSKLKVFISLLISGLIFTFALLISYVGLSTALGCAFGHGFQPNYTGSESYMAETVKAGIMSAEYMVRYVITGCLTYITITTFAVLAATLTRSIGPSIPLVIIPMILLALVPLFTKSLAADYIADVASAKEALAEGDTDTYNNMMQIAASFKGYYIFDSVLLYADPFYSLGSNSMSVLFSGGSITTREFIGTIVSNVSWSVIFSVLGAVAFTHRDLK